MSPGNPRTFSCTLEEHFSVNDTVWSFDVANLPRDATANASRLIKLISLNSTPHQQRMTLGFVPVEPNRAIDTRQLHRYMQISLDKFRLHVPSTASNEPQKSPSPRDVGDYKVRLLRHGITLNGNTYRFFGHSNSQLKTGTCYLFAGTAAEVSDIIDSLGEFGGIKTVAKKAKRIGLLFSAANFSAELSPDRCKDIPDIRNGDFILTDGCGLISKQFAGLLVQRANIQFRGRRFTPSVFQIRYRGYKGVLTLEPALSKEDLVHFRDSMRKFKGGNDHSFAVVDHARPYAFAYLNDEVILLLSELGISVETLKLKQREHLQFLQRAPNDALAAFRFLSQINNTALAERVLYDGIETLSAKIQKLVNNEISKMTNKRGESRSRILIPRSRLLFGICDPRGVLKEDECAVRVTMAGDGAAKTIVDTEVLVTRNPCLHPGDLRKFRAVYRPELNHLVDCIIFPTTGRRPSADLMSGGDLDGDKFLVCWDPDLIPARLSQPAHYVGAKEPVTFGPITQDDRLVYFATYNNASLGRVKNLYLDWAKVKGPMCAECQELNFLFSNCVDGNRIRVPTHLTKTPETADGSPFILDTLHAAAAEIIKEQISAATLLKGGTVGAVEVLLSRENIAMSEFELFRLTLRWCKENNSSVSDLLDFFDMNQFSDDQRAWILGHIAPQQSLPSLVLNALVSSSILQPSELSSFKLDLPGVHWKRTYSSSLDRLGLFLPNLAHTMELFDRKLIVFQVDNRLSVALYVPRRVISRQENVVDDSCRLFAFPHSGEDRNQHRRVVATRTGYRLYHSNTGLQLYNTRRVDTWVFIARPGADDASYRAIDDRGDRRRQRQATVDADQNADCIASIALNKFSSGIARHVGRVNRNRILAAEIYVITNRDVRSMQIQDEWLRFIDTQETVPLFEKIREEFSLFSLRDVDWSKESKLVSDVARHERFASLSSVSAREASRLFHWLYQWNQGSLLRRTYRYLLGTDSGEFRLSGSVELLEEMFQFLHQVPTLVLDVASIDWSQCQEHIRESFHSHIDILLKSAVLCANEMQDMVSGPFQNILDQATSMSLLSFGELVELIAIAVELPEVALDLLLGALEPKSSWLLIQRPAVMRYFVKNCIGIALEHIEEAKDSRQWRDDWLNLRVDCSPSRITARVRIDAHSKVAIANNDHIRLEAAQIPQNSIRSTPVSMHALVQNSQRGSLTFNCFHPPPAYLEQCQWRLKNCGSFVTTKAMFEAMNRLALAIQADQAIPNLLLYLPTRAPEQNRYNDFTSRLDLNPGQNEAVRALLNASLTCLWGPPGTGKTYTLAVALEELLRSGNEQRILVTAPTHNAVDNMLRAFLAVMKRQSKLLPNLVRVSTDIRKVADDLRNYTCDAMEGKDLNENPAARKRAQKQVDQARLVFTTCTGASLGLLRSGIFPIVIIDEASQQTEPQSLIPLTKGCQKAILVGDHVQLRATVHPHAQLQSFDISLFERLYTSTDLAQYPPSLVKKVMLHTQYRMHESICSFSSGEFYEGKLKTAVLESERPIPAGFPWPEASGGGAARLVFVECSHPEDMGQKSKNNQGQVLLARRICHLLLSSRRNSGDSGNDEARGQYSIAALTPYAACAKSLRSEVPPGVTVSSIDGFQGREADIVIYVTTRCNVGGEIGFLRDLRRLNVVLTRAKAGLVVIGNKVTLTETAMNAMKDGEADVEVERAKRTWARLIDVCVELA